MRQKELHTDQREWGSTALSSILAKAILDTSDIRSSQDLKIDDKSVRADYSFCFPPHSDSESVHFGLLYWFVSQVISPEMSYHTEGSRAIVSLQTGAENTDQSDLFYKDVVEYAGALDDFPQGGSFALMATIASHSYKAWDNYIAATAESARLLVRKSQPYRVDTTMLTLQHKQWMSLAESKVWTIYDMENACQDLLILEQRLHHSDQAWNHNRRVTRFLSQEVLPDLVDGSKPFGSTSDTRNPVSKLHSDLNRIDQLEGRVTSLKASLRHTRQLYDDRRQLALVRNSFDALKMEYISQNYIRVAAFLVILFLPGIFIAVSAHLLLGCIIPN